MPSRGDDQRRQSMNEPKLTSLARLQLDEAQRALHTAHCTLQLVAGGTADPALLSEVQWLHAALRSAADELAELHQRARLSGENNSCLNAAG